MDSVAAAIGHARAELREIAGLLGAPVQQMPRRRPKSGHLCQHDRFALSVLSGITGTADRKISSQVWL